MESINDIKNILPNIKHFCYATSHRSDDFCNFMKEIKFANIAKFDELSNLLADKISILKNDIDLIVSIPKSKDEQNEIDFSLRIAKTISARINIKYCNDLIIKTRTTRKLKTIPKELRKKEIKNAFEINNNYDLTNKKICIVDDVFSSGNTLKEAIKTLSKKIDVSNISVAILVVQN